MAPPRLYSPPLEQLANLMRLARVQGLSFELAWNEAVRPGRSIVMTTTNPAPAGAIRWPTDRSDRQGWQEAISGTREAWERAYNEMPLVGRERALLLLGDAFSDLDEVKLARLVAAQSANRARGIEGGRRVASVA